jgi:cytoskeletal protein CcmA (bactofilin family)
MTSADERSRSPEAWVRAAIVGRDLDFEGEVRGRQDLVIEGRLRGHIRLPDNDLLVAEDAKVEAEIQVRDIVVKGEVAGNVTASGRAVIEKTGRLDGDLSASMISVEDGARFKGSVRILSRT